MDKPYDTIVLSGGSTKGLVLLGALQYAYDNSMLKNISTYIGTSAGAMICYFLAIGYTPIEIVVYICTHRLLEKLQHFNIVAMINGNGATSFSDMQEQLERMTIEKIGYLPTFKDIKSKYGKIFICATHNLTKKKTEYLGPYTTPDLPCITALRMSSNLPLVFENYKYGDSIYIDGGVSDNFPVQLADEIGTKILGFVMSSDEKDFKDVKESDILQTIYMLMLIPVTQATEYKISQASEKCDIHKLNYDKVKVFDFNINSTEKLDMFSAGYKQCEEMVAK